MLACIKIADSLRLTKKNGLPAFFVILLLCHPLAYSEVNSAKDAKANTKTIVKSDLKSNSKSSKDNAKTKKNPAATNDKLRLKADENFSATQYSKSPPKPLNKAIDESKDALNNLSPSLIIDLKSAISDADNTNVLDNSLTKKADVLEHKVSIADIRAMALQNNLTIKIANIEPLVAETVVSEERAKFDNVVFANIRYGKQDLPGANGDTIQFKSDLPGLDGQIAKELIQAQTTKKIEAEAGIAIPLRTGGNVEISSPFDKKKTSDRFGSTQYNSALRFSFTQPLLRGAGVDNNEASINIAKFEQRAVDVKTRLQSIRVISMVDKAYWEVFQKWGQLDIRRQQYEYANQNLAMVKRRVQEGLAAKIEVSRAEIGVADRVESLIVAKTNLKLSQRQLKFLLNDEKYTVDSDMLFVPTTLPDLLYYDFDRQKVVDDALAGRLELLELELKLTADLTKIDYLENQTLPLFTLDYNYGALSDSGNRLNQSYDNVLDGRYSDWSIGLKFEMPMTNEARRARLERAIQQRGQRLTTKTLQELTVRREINDALDLTEQNWQKILTARQQVLIAGINYDAELKQFNEGLRSMTEVLETLTRLGEVQVKEINAVSDYQVSLIDLAYATGTLLGYSRVDF